MRIFLFGHRKGSELTTYLVPGFLLLAALLPAASLLYFRLALNTNSLPSTPILRELFVVVPLSTFLLAFFLCRERSRMHALMARDAGGAPSRDLLSGLPSPQTFDATFETALAQSGPEPSVALVAIDIDRFRIINDTYGHEAGDQMLRGVVARIQHIMREGDCLTRRGGDRFSLMLADVFSVSDCTAAAHSIHEAMVAPFTIGDMPVPITVSCGIALSPQDGDKLSTLVAAADLALERAKHDGCNRFAFFDKSMALKLHLGMTIEDALRAAIKAEELTVLYQPVMNGCATRMRGVEALVRWQHPSLGLIAPDDFIPLAERRGLIAPLGEWVLRRACHDATRWPALRVAVNVSPMQFRKPGFVDMVKGIIKETAIAPQRLELELTEGVLIQDAEQAEAIIMELRAHGIRMGLDDFGSGYSSMIYLRRFAFDKIKIDKGLMESMEPSGETAIILESIISLGHALGLTVTAEGVESDEQIAFLQRLGCDELQGYYFSPPITADAIEAMLRLERAQQAPLDETRVRHASAG